MTKIVTASLIIIYLIVLGILLTGLIVGIRQVNAHGNYNTGCIIMGVSIAATLISNIIGQLFSNGPVQLNRELK